jgi:hypothetical protein
MIFDQPSTESSSDLWMGIITILPVVLLYLRSVIAELGKVSAQALLKYIGKRLRKRQAASSTTAVVILLGSGTEAQDDASSNTKYEVTAAGELASGRCTKS